MPVLIISDHRVDVSLSALNVSHSIRVETTEDITLLNLEAVVAHYLNKLRHSDFDWPGTIDARVSGIDWMGINDMHPVSKTIVAVGTTSAEKHPLVFIIQEI